MRRPDVLTKLCSATASASGPKTPPASHLSLIRSRVGESGEWSGYVSTTPRRERTKSARRSAGRIRGGPQQRR